MVYIKGNFDIKFKKILTRSTSIKGVLFYFKNTSYPKRSNANPTTIKNKIQINHFLRNSKTTQKN